MSGGVKLFIGWINILLILTSPSMVEFLFCNRDFLAMNEFSEFFSGVLAGILSSTEHLLGTRDRRTKLKLSFISRVGVYNPTILSHN